VLAAGALSFALSRLYFKVASTPSQTKFCHRWKPKAEQAKLKHHDGIADGDSRRGRHFPRHFPQHIVRARSGRRQWQRQRQRLPPCQKCFSWLKFNFPLIYAFYVRFARLPQEAFKLKVWNDVPVVRYAFAPNRKHPQRCLQFDSTTFTSGLFGSLCALSSFVRCIKCISSVTNDSCRNASAVAWGHQTQDHQRCKGVAKLRQSNGQPYKLCV